MRKELLLQRAVPARNRAFFLPSFLSCCCASKKFTCGNTAALRWGERSLWGQDVRVWYEKTGSMRRLAMEAFQRSVLSLKELKKSAN